MNLAIILTGEYHIKTLDILKSHNHLLANDITCSEGDVIIFYRMINLQIQDQRIKKELQKAFASWQNAE